MYHSHNGPVTVHRSGFFFRMDLPFLMHCHKLRHAVTRKRVSDSCGRWTIVGELLAEQGMSLVWQSVQGLFAAVHDMGPNPWIEVIVSETWRFLSMVSRWF